MMSSFNAFKFVEEIHILKRLAIVAVIFFLMTVLHYSTLIRESDASVFSITLLGFMLILSYNLGRILVRFHLPKLTIYMISGLLCGPFITGFVTHEVISNLKFVDNLALSLIAFIAGGEMRLNDLMRLKKTLVGISAYETIYVMILCTAVFALCSPFIGFMSGQSWLFVGCVSLLVGTVLVANSPAVTIGIIGEYGSKGDLTEAVLGTVVLKDIIVIVLFAAVFGAVSVFIAPNTVVDFRSIFLHVSYEIIVSVFVGVAMGGLIWLYLRYVGEQNVLFILGAAFMSYELAVHYELEVLLIGLSAGFVVQNFTKQGEELIRRTEQSLPVVYPVFFSIAGAKMNLEALMSMWFLALALVAVRLVGIYYGSRTGARLSKSPAAVQKYAWMGLVSQAGVALGFAIVIGRRFPEWGTQLETLIIAVVGINQLAGPVFLKYALEKAGEIPKSAEETTTIINLALDDEEIRNEESEVVMGGS